MEIKPGKFSAGVIFFSRLNASMPQKKGFLFQFAAAHVRRLPGNIHMCFEGIEGESLILLLSEKGICASSGSAPVPPYICFPAKNAAR